MVPGSSTAAPARAILVSFDALNLDRLDASLPASAIPTFRAMAREAVCASGALPNFPSVTAPGHAALWTGAYGHRSGVSANEVPRLPRDAHTIAQTLSGYSSDALAAEPIWITAARAGRTVVGHHVTQAPGVPAFPPATRADSARSARRRTEAGAVLARPEARVVNGYNRTVAPDRVVTERDGLRAARGWTGLGRLPATAPPSLEVAWVAGPDSVVALVTGTGGAYTRVCAGFARDLAATTCADAHPADREPLTSATGKERPLARFFSPPLAHTVAGPDAARPEAARGRVTLRVRLFDLAADASRMVLFQPAMQVVEANRPDVAADYADAVAGWRGNGASGFVGRGFGPGMEAGGDGESEYRYVESAELSALTSIRGTEWAWRQAPDLLLDYFALGDEVDHGFYGTQRPESPFFDASLAPRFNDIRARIWGLADRKLALLRRLARDTPGTLLLVSGDHGMRPTWREFRPNAALAAAGLLVLDARGAPDLSKSVAYSPNGYFVTVNTTDHVGGIVPVSEKAAVVARVRTALLAVSGPDRELAVTQVWEAPEVEALGAGGPAGGDVYFEVGSGYFWSRNAALPAALAATRPGATHGYVSTAPDMQTAFCLDAPTAPSGLRLRLPSSLGPVRIVDAAPTVSDWLGLPAPPDGEGVTRLRPRR